MSPRWYVTKDGRNRLGPYPLSTLREMAADGSLGPEDMVLPEGSGQWLRADDIAGLFLQPLRPVPAPQAQDSTPPPAGSAGETTGTVARVADLFPFLRSGGIFLPKSYVFWALLLLGTVPLFLATIQENSLRMTGFALFFALLWGVLFKHFVIRREGHWGLLLLALFGTGIVGMQVLLWTYLYVIPHALFLPPLDPSPVYLLGWFILWVGLLEELCKAAPVAVYLLWKRRKIDPAVVLLLGVFSGLGFAAFENLHYGRVIAQEASGTVRPFRSLEGTAGGVEEAMATMMVRSISCVFLHAVLSGIVAYFVALAVLRIREPWYCLVGLGLAGVLHGLYDWLLLVQQTFAAFVAGFSFFLFWGYISRSRAQPRRAGRAD